MHLKTLAQCLPPSRHLRLMFLSFSSKYETERLLRIQHIGYIKVCLKGLKKITIISLIITILAIFYIFYGLYEHQSVNPLNFKRGKQFSVF